MGKIIAVGGGPNGGDFDPILEKQIRSFIQTDTPKVLFVSYASTEFHENYDQFKKIYESMDCEVRLLESGSEHLILESDLIYFGRGGTLPLMNRLEQTNAISLIHEAIEKGKIVAGFSAGAHALFRNAGSKEEHVGFTLVKGLGIYNDCIMTHYNYEERASAFHKLLKRHSIDGVGLEDHTMLVIENDLINTYTSKEDSYAYRIIMNEDEAKVIKLNRTVIL